MKNKAELLSPAGGLESFYASVNSGADAIYLGGKNFNARHYSENFDDDTMREIIKYAHNKNVKVYVTVNTILKNTELLDALNYIYDLYEMDVDAVIVQDIGLMYLINYYLPNLNVNVSTQATIYDDYGVKFFDYPCVSKHILSRELSIDQIDNISKNNKDTDIETFIHGALCMSYSGQCYMSSYFGGRSGNRGKCAQPCRLDYCLLNSKNESITGNQVKKPYLSLKDFKAGDLVEKLVSAGVETLKIEGRMKNPEYTAIVTEYYRNLLDLYYDKLENNIDDKNLKKRLEHIAKLEKKVDEVFSRGFTDGYLLANQRNMFSDIATGSKGSSIENIISETQNRTNPYYDYKKNAVSFEIEIKIGQKARLSAIDEDNNKIEIFSDEIVEISSKNPINQEIIDKQLNKLGNSTFECKEINHIIDDNAFLSKSTINKLRRDAIEKLYDIRANHYHRQPIKRLKLKDLFSNLNKDIRIPKISLKINSREDLRNLDLNKISRIYVPLAIYRDIDLNFFETGNKIEKVLYMENILSDFVYDELKNNIEFINEKFDGVCVNNPGTFYFFKKMTDLKIYCGYHFNVINSYDVRALQEKGASGITFSIESNIKDIESMSKYTDLSKEVVAYAFIKLMSTKNCPFSQIKGCKGKGNCSKCEYRTGNKLQDRKNISFNVERENGVTGIYNSVPLNILGKTEEFLDSNIEYYFVDTKWSNDYAMAVDLLYDELNKIYNKTSQSYEQKILRANSFTRGHYFKNTL